MRFLIRLVLGLVTACLLSACLFTEPVFQTNFTKADQTLGGVWVSEGENGDPRKMEFAVCAPLDDERLLIHYPSGEKGGIYYEAKALKIGERRLLQLRVLASLDDGLPKADAERYTLLWLEKNGDDPSIRVRALGGEGVKEKGAAAVRTLLNDPATDWGKLFGEPMVFRRLKDNQD